MKLRVYADSSVIGGIFDDEFEEWSQKLLRDFIEGQKILVISDLMLREIEDAPDNVRAVLDEIPNENKEYITLNDDAKSLAQKYIEEGAISKKHLVDAQHIALATIQKIDVLVSWNFQHIVNLRRIRLYNAVNLKYGYHIIEIRTPREVLDEE